MLQYIFQPPLPPATPRARTPFCCPHTMRPPRRTRRLGSARLDSPSVLTCHRVLVAMFNLPQALV